MGTRLNPYINFGDQARAAMEFYREVLGGTLTFSTFGEYGMDASPEADKIMHSQLESPGGLTLMGADTPAGMPPHQVGNNISVCLSGEDVEELSGYFAKLAVGGTVGVPLEKQVWGDHFGMVTDRFGINWMVNIAGTSSR
ncbi:VOC family protein [Crossiella sp. CA198]|uniref:VOC family protein n=1 Tax=Crossiella sp. CA198 TaxID=3455607 RepID=UPI003F8D1431